jgi:hypothetical protein
MTRATRPTIKHIYQNFILDSTHWHGFQVRDGDIVIATSYKTGIDRVRIARPRITEVRCRRVYA